MRFEYWNLGCQEDCCLEKGIIACLSCRKNTTSEEKLCTTFICIVSLLPLFICFEYTVMFLFNMTTITLPLKVNMISFLFYSNYYWECFSNYMVYNPCVIINITTRYCTGVSIHVLLSLELNKITCILVALLLAQWHCFSIQPRVYLFWLYSYKLFYI